MKKLLIIISLSMLTTFLIYKYCRHEEVHLLALGDGIATGITPYNMEGYNYNDYLRDYLEKEEHLHEYNISFASKTDSSFKLLMKLMNNEEDKNNNRTIQYAISKATIITLGIGLDELGSESLKRPLDKQFITDYLSNINSILKQIRKLNDKKIYLIGIYKSYNITNEEVRMINQQLESITKQYNTNFISIEDVIEHPEFFFDQSQDYLNYKGQKFISDKIISFKKK